jgi:RNA recognition motif-containing protein
MRFRMNTRVYVSNLPETTTENSLQAAFGPFGTISKIFLATDRDTALPTYAFVTYATAGDMTASIEGMNEADFHGRKLSVSVAREAQVAPAPRRIVLPMAGPRRGPGGPARGPVRR